MPPLLSLRPELLNLYKTYEAPDSKKIGTMEGHGMQHGLLRMCHESQKSRPFSRLAAELDALKQKEAFREAFLDPFSRFRADVL